MGLDTLFSQMRKKPVSLSAVKRIENLAICWELRESESTRKSKNLFGADNQQGRLVNFVEEIAKGDVDERTLDDHDGAIGSQYIRLSLPTLGPVALGCHGRPLYLPDNPSR